MADPPTGVNAGTVQRFEEKPAIASRRAAPASEAGVEREDGGHAGADRNRSFHRMIRDSVLALIRPRAAQFPVRRFDDPRAPRSAGTWPRDAKARHPDDALHEHQERLRMIIDTAADGIVTAYETGKILEFNAAAVRLFGYPVADAIGRNVRILMGPSNAGWHDTFIAKYLRTGKATIIGAGRELEARRRDGSTFPIHLTISHLALDGGHLFTAIIRDITDRRRAEDALRRSEQMLRGLLDSSPARVALLDPDGTVCYVNEAWRRFGRETGDPDPDRDLGSNYFDVCEYNLGDGAKMIAAGLRSLLKGDRDSLDSTYARRLPGQNRWYRLVARPVSDVPGIGAMVMHIDITDMILTERALAAAKEEAEAANRAKSEFLSSMSHELRTPLNAILGFGQLLQFNPEEPLSEAQHEYVGDILSGGQHLLELVNGVLDLAKVETGRIPISITTLPVAGVFAECMNLTRTIAARRGIDLIDRTHESALPPIRADRMRFKQVLLNLLSNAIKYNRENGTVTFDCAATSGGMLRVKVSDQGPGIPEDQHNRLFEPFVRLDAEHTDAEGTGIGLTITHLLVAMMGGEMGFDTVVGEGSTFWVELPLAPEGGGATVPRERAEGRARRNRPHVYPAAPGLTSTNRVMSKTS